jgi:hypothetical protein
MPVEPVPPHPLKSDSKVSTFFKNIAQWIANLFKKK